MMKRLIVRYRDAETGSVSMEFILIWPFLLLWLVASYVFFDVYKSQSKSAKAAYTISDIISRQEEVDTALLDDLDVLLDKLLPRSSDQKWMRISSVFFNGTDYEVDWSYPMNPPPNGDPYQNKADPMTDEMIPLPIMPQLASTDSVILVEINIPYDPIVSNIGLTDQTWEPRIIVRPRYIAKIAKID